jgi:uncharacterized low-complexity protein
MSNITALKPLTVALGTVFTVSLANISISNASENPFTMQPLSSGYMMLAEGKCGEGKCGGGTGKGMQGGCGMTRMDADGDGNVSKDEFMKGHAAKFDEIDKNSDGVIDQPEGEAHMQGMKAMKEGKCGEGKCGGSKQ